MIKIKRNTKKYNEYELKFVGTAGKILAIKHALMDREGVSKDVLEELERACKETKDINLE